MQLTSIDIQKVFKNRYPLLMIDKVDYMEPGKHSRGYKLFSTNEWFFPAHFADNPNVPGTIMLECMLDLFCVTILTLPECAGKETADVKINNLQFKQKLVPGDCLQIECGIDSFKRGVASGRCEGALLGGVLPVRRTLWFAYLI